jgi:hypothetical protein
MPTDLQIILTDHAVERAKERLGLKRSPLLKAATRAWVEGLKAAEARGQLRRWMDGESMKGGHVRLWEHHLYVFKGRNLITILTVPPHLRRSSVDHLRKKRR